MNAWEWSDSGTDQSKTATWLNDGKLGYIKNIVQNELDCQPTNLLIFSQAKSGKTTPTSCDCRTDHAATTARLLPGFLFYWVWQVLHPSFKTLMQPGRIHHFYYECCHQHWTQNMDYQHLTSWCVNGSLLLQNSTNWSNHVILGSLKILLNFSLGSLWLILSWCWIKKKKFVIFWNISPSTK